MIPLRREKIRLIDSLAINDYKIPSLILMENAGIKSAEIILKDIPNFVTAKAVVLCGKGNNGGDGYVIARHLANAGISTKVFLFSDRNQISGDAKTNLTILYNMKILVEEVLNLERVYESINDSTIVIDAMLGTGVDGEIKESFQSVIRFLNGQRKTVYAIDTPTGLDCNTGNILGECVNASKTLTFIAPKIGFFLNEGPSKCGEIITIDISVPTELVISVQQKELDYIEAQGIDIWKHTKEEK